MATKYVIRKSFDPKNFRVDYQTELNAEQLDVVQHGEGPCLVLAGAGSGKTRTIVFRVAYLIERGVRPENILLVTFTNKAAKEMLYRVEQLLGTFPKSLHGGTFHHEANVLLRKYAPKIGYSHNFTILDDEDSKDLIGVCVKALGIDTKKTRFPSNGVLNGLMSLAKNTGVSLDVLLTETRPEFAKILAEIVAVSDEYERRKQRNNAMDFDDLLTNLLKLLREHDDVRQRLAEQFHYILVDEYQDTNHLQAEIVQRLSTVHRNILVVGDDAQSIYSFRGADIKNILNFPKQFSDCRTFKLELNYRSTQPILDVANDVIRHNQAQFKKKLQHVRTDGMKPIVAPAISDEQEAEFIAQRVLELRDEGVPLRDIAVLFRAAFHSQSLEFELTRRDIPYEYRGGVRFFDRAHIKDTLAHLKIVANPSDEVAFLRVMKLQTGIGDQTAAKIFDELHGHRRADDQHPLESAIESYRPPARAERGWSTFRNTLGALLAERAGRPETLIRLVMDSEYRDYLKNQYPDAHDRIQDLDQLALFAGKYDSLDNFLSEVSLQESFGLVGGEAATGSDEKIVLSTIHQAKGLEWRAVFVMHLAEQYFPNPRALAEAGGLEEERRLFYVAVTRAKDELYLTYSLASGYRTMSMHLNAPSPFVKEIPHRLLEPYELQESMTDVSDQLTDPDQVIELNADGAPKGLLDRVLKSNQDKRERRKRNANSWTHRSSS